MIKIVVFVSVFALALGAPSGESKADPGGRIVGGQTVDIANYPYQVALLNNNNLRCGGVLISADKALTAAHCVVPGEYVLSQLSLRGGSSYYYTGGQQVALSHVVVHEQYSGFLIWVDYDIAVLFLAEPMTHINARPIALAPVNYVVSPGAIATVSGWGTTTENGAIPDQLQMVQIPVVTQAVCRAAYSLTLTDNMWCAAVPEGGKDSCQGDSGGPAIVNGMLAGLVSFGAGCARAGNPGVYASIPAFRQWVLTNAGI